MSGYYIAVLDIGKTNKKILIYDQNLKMIDSEYEVLDETIKDGIIYDDVQVF